MSPGGHLVTTGALCGAVYALTGSTALTVGAALGGFLIDVDHVLDYVLFESRRELSPVAFLRHYTEQRHRLAVLLLHSYELLILLALAAWLTGAEWLWGYVLGMGLHLPLDIVFNGKLLSRNLVPFYSFAVRWHAGLRAAPLLGRTEPRPGPAGFWRSFFAELFPPATAPRGTGAPTRGHRPRTAASPLADA